MRLRTTELELSIFETFLVAQNIFGGFFLWNVSKPRTLSVNNVNDDKSLEKSLQF